MKSNKVKGLALLILLIVIISSLCSQKLEVDFYHLYSEKIDNGKTIRLIVLSDLHNHEFGINNEELAEKIKSLSPDIIIMAGDMVNQDDPDISVVTALCRQLIDTAPIYYGLGNHEGIMIHERGIPLHTALRELGVTVLADMMERTQIKEIPFLIGSVSTGPTLYDQYSKDFVEQFEEAADDSVFKLMISHVPSLYYEKMAETKLDLAVCGHFHGGQIRIPLLGGVYAADEGFFPKYSGGMYELANSWIFVSRGLGNNHMFPRINNRPQLAVIDINGRDG